MKQDGTFSKIRDSRFVVKTREVIKRRYVWLPLNFIGVFVGALGLIICLGLIFGSVYAQNEIKARITKVDKKADIQFDLAMSAINKVEKTVKEFTLPETVDETITDVADKNIQRLELLSLALTTIDVGNRLEEPIERIDNTIDTLEDIRDNSPLLSLAKEKVLEKIDLIQERIVNAQEEFNDGVKTARQFTSLGAIAIIILSGIFLVGEVTLCKRCIGHLREARRLRKSTVANA